ncbi:MAG: tRNA (adenosine(37)-N6)-threonylcarbamoyltransferase complex transferase subunit TsaD [Clostridia bacterium]|nr:tRNA (adenosine(37)-N6)-threonylcarbamoyltransferase complex transferase subunit TsaD [Clostridia bacterium]
MYILGIESSCDETSAAVLFAEGDFKGKINREVKSNIVASQIETHRLYGGVVPEIASRAHIEAITRVTERALSEAGVTIDEIGAIAVTAFPGLIGALLVGVNFAKSLAFSRGIPLVAVNHIKAHVAAAYIEHPELCGDFPALVVSGGHTSIYSVKDYTNFSVLGETRDDAAGEAFDKVGRVIGLPYPGGAAMDKLAYEGNGDAISLPSPALPGDTLDFSFSGLKTASLNYINSASQKGEEINRADVAASFTKAVVGAIVGKAKKALELTGSNKLILAGGVAANSHIRRALSEMCEMRGAKLYMPSISLCGDNAAMVAMAGYFEFLKGNFADTYLNASANDEI